MTSDDAENGKTFLTSKYFDPIEKIAEYRQVNALRADSSDIDLNQLFR